MQRTYRHNTKTPNVNFGAVLFARDDFRRHPVRSTYHCRALRLGRVGYLGAESEIG